MDFQLPTDATVVISDLRHWTSDGSSAVWSRRWSSSVGTSLSVGRSRYESAREQAWLLSSPSQTSAQIAQLRRGGSHGVVEQQDLTDTTIRADGNLPARIRALAVGRR